jgi:hypothetical protein
MGKMFLLIDALRKREQLTWGHQLGALALDDPEFCMDSFPAAAPEAGVADAKRTVSLERRLLTSVDAESRLLMSAISERDGIYNTNCND